MAEKVIKTRIINKHGALSDWLTSSLVLKEGEIALAYVETTKPNGQGGTYTVPTYLMKVGDGTNTFSGLEWVAAPASDVYEWAKKANLALSDIPMIDVANKLQDLFYTEGEIDSKITALNNAINGKAASSHTHGNITNDGKLGTASRVVITGTDNKVTVSDITTTELGYLDGVTSNIQTQLSGKAAKATTLAGYGIGDAYTKGDVDAELAKKSDTGHTHNYAGSSSAGGAATSANKVNKSITFNNGGAGADSGITFDGSTARTISYNTIGAAPASHVHTVSQITDFAHSHNDLYYTEGEIDSKITILNTAISGKADSGHNHDSVYITPAAVDTKISTALGSVLKYKGTKNGTSNLPTSGNSVGDVWNITNACAASGSLPAVNAGDNVAWNGSAWDVLAGTVDLSNYYNKSEVNAELAKKSDTHDHPYLSNTTKYAASSSVGGAATSANKVNKSLVVKLNSGSTEGTNLFTFDGSAAKTINVTPSAIGAYTTSEVDSELAKKANTDHGTHVTAATVKSALGTGTGTTKFLREDGTWVKPSYISDTHRSWKVNGSSVSALSGTKTDVNLNQGTNISISASGTDITVSAPNVYTKSEVDSKVAAVFDEVVFDCGGPND